MEKGLFLRRGRSCRRYLTTKDARFRELPRELWWKYLREMMDYWNAFWVGGLICALVQILLDRTETAAGQDYGAAGVQRGVFKFSGTVQPLVDYAGAGASVPLLGFGNILWEGMRQSIEEQGVLGLFTGGFQACAVGVSAALIFSYLASLVFRPKMKK